MSSYEITRWKAYDELRANQAEIRQQRQAKGMVEIDMSQF